MGKRTALGSLVLVSAVVGVIGTAFAQKPAAPPASAPGPEAPAAQPGATASAEPAKVSRPAAGYGWSDTKPKRGTGAVPRAARATRSGAAATFPSFSASEVGSRLVVHLSSSTAVEEHKAAGSVTYVLKGAHVNRWNDTNPLVTVHFNTPVAQARLVPHGADLHLVVQLRAAVSPTYKVTAGQAGAASLEIDFPKGEFGGGDLPTVPKATTKPATPAATPTVTPAPSAAPAPAQKPGPTP